MESFTNLLAEKYKALKTQWSVWWKDSQKRQIAACIALALAFSAWAIQPKENNSTRKQVSFDTFIPRGFVLVPLDIENAESIESLVGPYTVVDLYAVENARSKLVARGLRMLKSPVDSGRFAVLTPEQEAHRLVQHTGPFRVAVQNPGQREMEFAGNTSKRKIIFERKRLSL